MELSADKQAGKNKLSAFERISLLLDENSFTRINAEHGCDISEPTDGVITGKGTVCGKPVFVFSEDFSFSGGSIGLCHGRKIAELIDSAISEKCPVIGIYDSVGARIEEGVNALAGCGEMINGNVRASGVIPQIAVCAGPCAGAAAYSLSLCDFVFAVDGIGKLFVTGNKVIENITGEKCDLQQLGGAKMHAAVSGVAHFLNNSETECFEDVRRLIGVLPSSNEDKSRFFENGFVPKNAELEGVVPKNRKTAYPITELIERVFDDGSFIEVHRLFADNLTVGFAKLSGITVGVVANNPRAKAGCLDADSSDKAARFIRFCDSFSIPIITFVDTPGFLPGVEEERRGLIRHGAKILYAYSEATASKLTVIIRKAYGGAYIAMGSKHVGADFVYTSPLGEIAVMGEDSAITVLFKGNPDDLELKNRQLNDYKERYMNYNDALTSGHVDGVLNFGEIRERLFGDIVSLKDKSGKSKLCHGNMPL